VASLPAERVDRLFERLYRQYARDVYRYALASMRNAADAEDVAQTTFLNAYRAIARGVRPRTPLSWLLAIAHNVCRQRCRQSARRPVEVALHEGLEPDSEDGERVRAEEIRRALSHLSPNQQAALVMRELEGRTYAEIAELLGLTRSAVETLLFRARRALREQLDGGLVCADAERVIASQLGGQTSLAERRRLRAHLRECRHCARLARRHRGRRSAVASGLATAPAATGGMR
jgi:RNA polymerase sigma-70 factor, ECF subfamily